MGQVLQILFKDDDTAHATHEILIHNLLIRLQTREGFKALAIGRQLE